MKSNKAILLFSFLILFGSLKGQRYYRLPDDPIQLNQVYDYNWLKRASEKAINNSDKESYQFLYRFMRVFFLEHRDRLTAISKDQWASKTVFDWAKPYIKAKIMELELKDRILLYNSLKRTQVYLKNFNYSNELKFLAANESLFAWYAPTDFFDKDFKYPYPNVLSYDYRDFEAFMFRRIRSGVDKAMIERFLNEIISSLDVNFSRQVLVNNEDEAPLYDFFWDKNQFKGIYREYSQFEKYGQPYNTSRTWLKVIGEYQNGMKVGVWKFFTTDKVVKKNGYNMVEAGSQPHIDYEIEYTQDKPIKLKQYFDDIARDPSGENVEYKTVFTLDVVEKVLNVDVFHGEKLFRNYNSTTDYISYWDIYETHRRIENDLDNPNFNIPHKRKFTYADKPTVTRNKETNNYRLYDDLKRKGKDHALFIAIDEYENYETDFKLRNPIRDAEEIASNLKVIFGFEYELVKNPKKAEFEKVMEKYQRMKFDSSEQLLIYLTGHGMYDQNFDHGYIVPKDGKSVYNDASHTSWISYDELSSAISKIPCQHILVMIDACYSGAFEKAVAKLKDGSDTIGRKMSDPKVWFLNKIRFKTRMYITSSSADRKVSDGINQSPFANRFILALQSIGDRDAYILDVEDVYAFLHKLIPTPRKDNFPGHEAESSFFFVMQ